MITRIGIVAGEIWSYLDNHERSARLDDLIGDLRKDRDVVLMSIGWLAREGHIVLEGETPDYLVRLSETRVQK